MAANKDDDESQEVEIKAKRPKKVILIIVFAAILGILIAFLYAQFINYLTAIPETKVPNIIGLEEKDAQETLKKAKLEGYLLTKKYSATISTNKVMKTVPEIGDKVKAGRKIGYVLSLGIEGGMAPDLGGLTLEQALQEIEGKEYYKIQEAGHVYSSGMKEGRIVSQDPLAGHYCTPDVPIKVYISEGYPIKIDFQKIEEGSNKLQVKIDLQILGNAENKKTNVRIISIKDAQSKVLYSENVLPDKELYFELDEEIGAKIEVYFNGELAKSKEVIL